MTWGVGVARGVARTAGVARTRGVGAGVGDAAAVGVATGVDVGAGVAWGVGVGVACGADDGRLKPSRPCIVCAGGFVCAATGHADAPASRMAIAPDRARRKYIMDPVLTQKRLPAP